MKKSQKLLLGFVVGLLLNAAAPLRPAYAEWTGTYLETSNIVNVSSQTAAPSTLIAATNSLATVYVWCHQQNVAGETILIQSSSAGFSTSSSTGTARITCTPTNQLGEFFILDNYRGPLFAITNSTYTIPCNVMRKK